MHQISAQLGRHKTKAYIFGRIGLKSCLQLNYQSYIIEFIELNWKALQL